MVIDIMDNYWFFIDKQFFGLCRNFLNIYFICFIVYDCIRWIFKQYNKCVEVWLLRMSNEGVNIYVLIYYKMFVYYFLSNFKKDRV